MRRLVIGDIHGNFQGMMDVLNRADFLPSVDMLIGIGDYVDGYPESQEVIDFLMMTPNFIGVLGNHDLWFLEWMKGHFPGSIWTTQGGDATLASFNHTTRKDVLTFLKAMPKYLELDNMLFVHGGYNTLEPIEDQVITWNLDNDLTWNRDLFFAAFHKKTRKTYQYLLNKIIYDRVFLGHTTTQTINNDLLPLFSDKVIGIDTGGGWNGKITVMDIDTLEYWQSDIATSYYEEGLSR